MMQNGHWIEASTLKISALLKNLILGRGLGSVFRHQYPRARTISGPFSFSDIPGTGGDERTCSSGTPRGRPAG